MQHHQKRDRLGVVPTWNIELVCAASCIIGVVALNELSAVGNRDCRGAASQGTDRSVEAGERSAECGPDLGHVEATTRLRFT
jgi:hypothetical protein